MSHEWIDRFTCDRCGLCIEQSHSNPTWPKGWKEVSMSGDKGRLLCPKCVDAVHAALATIEGAKP